MSRPSDADERTVARIVIFPEAGKWTWEPRDGRGRPAWRWKLPWNQHGGLHTKEAAISRARRQYRLVPIVDLRTGKRLEAGR